MNEKREVNMCCDVFVFFLFACAYVVVSFLLV
jgi:hypothetical protein